MYEKCPGALVGVDEVDKVTCPIMGLEGLDTLAGGSIFRSS